MKNVFLFVAGIFLTGGIGTGIAQTPAPARGSFFEMKREFSASRQYGMIEKSKGWKYYKRWESEQEMHTMGNGMPANPELFFEGLDEAIALKSKSPEFLTSTASPWVSMGPHAVPPSDSPFMQHGIGRINTIAFHPSLPGTYWVGVAQGGIWKTADNGNSWFPQTDNLPVTRVSDIAVDPNNPDILYAALGDFEYIGFGLIQYGRKRNSYFGVGIYKSTDGGNSWNPTGLSYTVQDGEASLIKRIIVNPSNSNQIVAAGASGLFTSGDGGNSWTTVLDSLMWDLEMDPVQNNVLYAAGGYLQNPNIGFAGIFKSNDFGQTWALLPTGIPATGVVERIKISIAPSNPNIIYATTVNLDHGLYGIYKSLNAGASWVLQFNSLNLLDWEDGTSTGGQGTYDLVAQVNPSNPDEFFVGGINLWGTSDGGLSFDPVSYWVGYYGPSIHADQHLLKVHPLTNQYFICNDGGLYRSAGLVTESWSNIWGGSSWPTVWNNISNGMAISSYYRISSSRANDGRVMAGAQDNSSVFFNGTNWTAVIGGDGMDNWISPSNPQVFIGSYQYGNFEQTMNGGSSFNSIGITFEEGEWTTPLVAAYNQPGTLFAGFGNVHKSDDEGFSWNPISNFPASPGLGYILEISALAVAPSDPDVIYLTKRVRHEFGLQGSCYKTTTGGPSWQNITSGLPDSLYFTSVEVADDDPQTVWVTCGGFEAGVKIFKTTDGGSTWQNISMNLPNLPANVVKQVAGSHHHLILVGMDVGIYYLNDSISSWLPFSTGLPNVIVSDLEVNPVTKKVYASTFGRGIWMTDAFDTLFSSVSPKVARNNLPKVFPNPVLKGKTIQVSFSGDWTASNLTFMDIHGKTVLEINSFVSGTSLGIPPHLPSGTYLLKLESANGNFIEKVMVE